MKWEFWITCSWIYCWCEGR